MTEDKSLTPQEVAERLKIAKNTVYELIKRGELRSYRVGKKIRVSEQAVDELTGNIGKKDKLSNQLPDHSTNPIIHSENARGFIICGQDGILDILARYIEKDPRGLRTYRSHMGSYNGLFALYKGEVDIATCHLWDGEKDVYNSTYAVKMLPGISPLIIRLVKRMQGFYIKKGNPKKILEWPDLFRADVNFINREKGSGTRVLLDEQARLLNRSARDILGYRNEATSHLAVAGAVARGEADVGLGNEKAALQVPGIEFVPLQRECYDLVMPRENSDKYPFNLVIETVNSLQFKQGIASLGGYDVSEMGKIIL